MQQDDPYLTIEEVAALVRTSPKTIRRRCANRTIRHTRTRDNGTILIRESWLVDWMREHERPPVEREKAVA